MAVIVEALEQCLMPAGLADNKIDNYVDNYIVNNADNIANSRAIGSADQSNK